MSEERLLDISWNTIFKIIFTFFIIYLIFLIKEILILVFFSVILAILFEPAISFFQKIKARRFFATILVYLLFFFLFATFLYFLTSVLGNEAKKVIQIFPQFFEKLQPPFKTLGLETFEGLQSFLNYFQEWLSKASSSLFSAIISIFGGIFTAFTIFIFAIFISLEEGSIERLLNLLVPKKYENLFEKIWQNTRQKVVSWFAARILTCFSVGLMVYLTCYFLDIEYGGVFAFLAGFLDLIPILGPFLAAIPIIFTAFFNSWLKAIFAAIALILIQQIEGNILTPVLTQRFLKISPFLILFSLLVGGKLFGFLGAVFAIPLFAIIFEIGREFLILRKSEGFYE